MVCLGKEQRWFCPFGNCIQDCILDPSVDYEWYSISSKGFLLMVAGKRPAGAQECGEVGGETGTAQETGTRFPLASEAYVFGNFISYRSHVPSGTHFPLGYNSRHTSQRQHHRHQESRGWSSDWVPWTHGRKRVRSAFCRIKVLASQVNWHLGMVSCVSNSGQFLLDSSPCVNFIIPVVVTKTSHSGDENWGDRGWSWRERHQSSQANIYTWGWS